jgi:hypothetical protein
VLPSTSTNQTPLRQTFANLLCSSVLYNEMIRQGDFVQMSAINNFSFYVSPVGGHTEPVNPRTILFDNNALLSDGKILNASSSNMPVYNVSQSYESIGQVDSVPYLDVLAVRKANIVYLTIINRNIDQLYPCEFSFSNGKIQSAIGYTYISEDPFGQILWTNSVPSPSKQSAGMSIISGTSSFMNVSRMSYSFIKITLSE